mmetsp:Transcript_54622/g.130341  ORF Transcript_54622/g.130341 Transcript_54622/m.130341 type:complete len:405 (-) Transcript_54622:82-1296(-)
MVLLSEDGTRFSWFEYQVLMLSLAGVMCVSLAAVEVTLTRFQSLPVLFPSMFSVHDRRFYIYELDITHGRGGKAIRRQAKNVIRMTILVVLSYLWQNCVLHADQKIGTAFPVEQCEAGSDCFASEVHISTIFTRQYTAVQCNSEQEAFETRQVISCVRFAEPSASAWLMHLAIANSVAQLNFKCFELGVWLAGKSKAVRHVLVTLMVLSALAVIALFFLGALSSFVSSWLSFVMTLSLPLWFSAVHASGYALKVVWEESEKKMQQSIEKNLLVAFQDIESVLQRGSNAACDMNATEPAACGMQEQKAWDKISTIRSRAKRLFASMRGASKSGSIHSPDWKAPRQPGEQSEPSEASPVSPQRPASEMPQTEAAADEDADGGEEPTLTDILPRALDEAPSAAAAGL